MALANSTDQLIYQIERSGKQLTDDQKWEIEEFRKGQDLSQIVHFPGWDVVIATLKSYVDAAIKDLVDLAPGDPRVPTAHAAASALDDMYHKFLQDVQNAVEVASTVPDVLKSTL